MLKTNDTRRKAAEAASLSRMGSAIIKRKLRVNWIPEGSSDLGFTSGSKGKDDAVTVNVCWYNEEYMSDLDEIHRSIFRMGIFAHELLHQALTDFPYTVTTANAMAQAEAGIFMKFMNTLEDPAIEYFAPEVFGGDLLEALEYVIRLIYQKSPGIESSNTAFYQLINALIHFGDMGIIKGEFTFPEAFEYFKVVAPLYNEGITEEDAKKRIDISKECMERTRPLWEEIVKNEEEFKKLLEELMESMKNAGKGKPQKLKGKSKETDDDSSAAKRRSEILKKIGKSPAKDTSEEEKEDSGNGSEGESDKEEPEKGRTNAKESSNSDPENTPDHDEGNAETDDSTSNEDESSCNPEDITTSSDDAAEELGDYVIDDEMLERVEKSIRNEESKIKKEENKESEKDFELPDFEIKSKNIPGKVNCLNRKVDNRSTTLSQVYGELLREYSWGISNLTKSLKKLFEKERSEKRRSTRGGYNIIRGKAGTTARIFDRRMNPNNKKDARVVLCVDLSGSMNSGGKIEEARKAAIILAESLSNVGIPYSIMGFHADIGKAQAVHEHFVSWKGTKSERETLAGMSAGYNNFDGYSIRYASELLKMSGEEHRILFVISDGLPACYSYTTFDAGLEDTKKAIDDSRKSGLKVFGIAIGDDCSPGTLHWMYGKDFIHCDNPAALTNTLGKKLIKAFGTR